MIREKVLKEFSSWSVDKQLSEYQSYKSIGGYFTDADFTLMEMIINNPNIAVSVECVDGICDLHEESSVIKHNAKVKEILQPTW